MEIYTDGGIDVNPGGTGKWAAVFVLNGKEILRANGEIAKGGVFVNTSNRSELQAALEALKLISWRGLYVHPQIKLYSDSQYLVRGIKKIDSQKYNSDLWYQIKQELGRLPSVEFIWIRGHAGHMWNELADRLCSPPKIKMKKQVKREKIKRPPIPGQRQKDARRFKEIQEFRKREQQGFEDRRRGTTKVYK